MKHITIMIVVALLFLLSYGWTEEKTDDTGTVGAPQIRTVVKTKLIVPKDPTLAGLLSAQFPGVGQMYCRSWLRGTIFLLGTATLYGTANEYSRKAEDDSLTQDERDQSAAIAAGTFIAGLAVHVWNVIDAIKTAERHNHKVVGQHTTKDRIYLDVKVGSKTTSIGIFKRI